MLATILTRIAIAGPHGAGKTTFVRLLKERLQGMEIPVRVIADIARNCPIPVEGATLLAAQQWILDAQLRLEDRFKDGEEVCLYDGCSLAYLAYYEYCGGRSPDVVSRVQASMQQMDRLILLPAQERFLIDDGVRPIDPAFQRDIAREQGRLLGALSLTAEVLEAGWPEWTPADWLNVVRESRLHFAFKCSDRRQRGARFFGGRAVECPGDATVFVRAEEPADDGCGNDAECDVGK